jgi:hypothetical protein
MGFRTRTLVHFSPVKYDYTFDWNTRTVRVHKYQHGRIIERDVAVFSGQGAEDLALEFCLDMGSND